MADKKVPWTPYGLEALRIERLRRQRLFALLAALGLALLWSSFFQETTQRQIELSSDLGGSRIIIDTDDLGQREDKPLTVGLSPGRVTRADTADPEAGLASSTKLATPTFERSDPIPYAYYLYKFGPIALLALAAYLLARRPPKHQVNYGIYKGAMPYEMITATASRHVFTTRYAKTSLFGKRRADHLPSEVLIERMPVDEDESV